MMPTSYRCRRTISSLRLIGLESLAATSISHASVSSIGQALHLLIVASIAAGAKPRRRRQRGKYVTSWIKCSGREERPYHSLPGFVTRDAS
ncbi:MAG: hypothetical protein ACI9G1_001009 [Pirellulaceae bacterium]|jgi:hypothetical protein